VRLSTHDYFYKSPTLCGLLLILPTWDMDVTKGEFVDHLLLHCEVAYAFWNVFSSRFGLSWVMPKQVVDLYTWWIVGNTRSVAVWKMVSSCLLCCLWREMNWRSFKDWGDFEGDLSLYFLTHCIFGQLLLFLLWWLVIMIFFLFS
jgi:hypothetical protein